MRPVQVTRSLTRRGLRTRRETLAEPPVVVLEQPLPNGKACYLALPSRETFKTSWGRKGVRSSEVLVRAQWRGMRNSDVICRNLVFPAPALHDATTYDPAANGKPDFNENDQLFWADEQTHKTGEVS